MTLFVLGAGFSCAQTKISNHVLHELNTELAVDQLEREVGIVSRCSSLPESYLRSRGETSSVAVKTATEESPSELGYRACVQALQRGDVNATQIGLIVCDCGTPYDFIPAQSHRIGEKFKIKIPSFDLVATTGPVPAQLEMLQDWRDERVPEYTLLTATNTPTQWTDSAHGVTPFFFGDAAGALLVSSQHSGKLALVKAALYGDPKIGSAKAQALGPAMSFDLYQHAIYTRESEATIYELAERAARDAFAEVSDLGNNQPEQSVKFIGPQWNPVADRKLAESLRVPHQNIWSAVSRFGNSLGSLPVVTLAEQWDAIQPGDLIVSVQVGASLSYGYAIFKAMQL